MTVTPLFRIALALCLATAVLPACGDCTGEPLGEDDSGTGQLGEGGHLLDAGPRDGGAPVDSGAPIDAGPQQADVLDGGLPDASFDWSDLFDGGLPEELACLPGTMPDLSGGITAILGALQLSVYSGRSETGVVCGKTTCANDVPCCVLCGWVQCAEPGQDGGPPTCPSFTQTFACDGEEDCDEDPQAETCCYSLSGTQCTAEDECVIDLSFLDAGFANPFTDGGPSSAPDDDDAGEGDGGSWLSDAGAPDAAVPDLLGEILDQGVPICRSVFDCGLLSGDLCCSSELFVGVDLGLCIPALACLGGGL